MALFLYRLGSWTAAHAWRTLGAWAAILALAVTSFLTFGGALASSFDIPGTEAAKVTDELAEKLPDLSGGAGAVVLQTTDGEPFTQEQKDAVADLVADAGDLQDVSAVVDPFATEAQLAEQANMLTDGREQLDSAREELESGQAQLDAGSDQLEAAQAQLDRSRNGATGAAAVAIASQQAQLDAQAAELETQQETLDAGRTELDEQTQQLEDGAELFSFAENIGSVSDDGTTAIVNVSFDVPQLALSNETREGVIDYVSERPIDGVDVEFANSLAQATPSIFGPGEAIGLIIAAIVLFVMLGTALAATLPLVSAIVGIGVALTAALAFSGAVEMASVTPVLGLMLGLAVGIDYSLFILNRHRKQLIAGTELQESIGLANGTAGNAVVFAGSTVVVALLALNITGVPFLGLMGTVGAVSVAVAVLVAITLTPAMLGLAKLRVLSKKERAHRGRPPQHRVEKQITSMRTGRAVISVVAGAAVLLLVAAPALSMRLGLPDGSSEPEDSTQYRAHQITSEEFGDGVNGTLLVTAHLPEGISDDDVQAEQLDTARSIANQDDVSAVAPIAVSDDNILTAFQVIPDGGPNDASTEDLVRSLRDLPAPDGSTLGVAGQAATNIDISGNLADVLPLYVGVVVGLSFLIMVVVFRSLLVPLIATAGFILSLIATYGALTAVFQWGWLGGLFGIHDPGPILSFLPVILVGILFGLAMDYQLFLTAGMREAFVHGSPARLAVMQGFRAGRSVVTAAALIMVSVFSGFIFAHSTIIRAVGFGLAFGVLVDAFIIRMLVVPALMHLIGRHAWWVPGWLERILPNVDVEGAALEREHPPVQ
ncbi:RND transporter [Arthrobacter sp. RIT-PI-e]|uniref:MMPL family transporter n=1 Tax=Arthrobacter sp. RIT-PI-e TaxID=1681197 RepID=UPI000675DDD8|nr:MMPL family transporter [Arthrobacter sp. RIT-PI-e]KNC19833.1 RND transporter [Arthrobacter sp. RIT-PI-e]